LATRGALPLAVPNPEGFEPMMLPPVNVKFWTAATKQVGSNRGGVVGNDAVGQRRR
jgi:hypothetical protein